MGHYEGYAHLPWPSDVSKEQVEAWREEYECGSSCVGFKTALANPVPSQLDRIEAKLDALLEALADEGVEAQQLQATLDGERVGGERDDSQPL